MYLEIFLLCPPNFFLFILHHSEGIQEKKKTSCVKFYLFFYINDPFPKLVEKFGWTVRCPGKHPPVQASNIKQCSTLLVNPGFMAQDLD